MKPFLIPIFFLLVCGEGLAFDFDIIHLPPLVINGQPARVHTQGLEVIKDDYYVTGRREDVQPRQALLLRTTSVATNWEVWNITPTAQEADRGGRLDHPGGMQSDGQRLWIPISQSKPKSSTLIRAFSLTKIAPGRPLVPDFEFSVNDHIGALAVAATQHLLFGPNWDTERVYVWNFEGELKQTLADAELSGRGLGATGSRDKAGIAVQDWKMTEQGLLASGLLKNRAEQQNLSRSRLIILKSVLETNFQRETVILSVNKEVELAREAMAISADTLYFLPEDLAATNRLFRVKLSEIKKLP